MLRRAHVNLDDAEKWLLSNHSVGEKQEQQNGLIRCSHVLRRLPAHLCACEKPYALHQGSSSSGHLAEGAGWKRGGADRRACFRAREQPIIRASQGRGDSKELGQLPNVNADRTMNSRILGHPEVGRRQTGYPRSVAMWRVMSDRCPCRTH